MNFFSAERYSDRITIIRTLSHENMYLVEGTTRAALIDTSVGIVGLRKFVENLTDLPITVILTHGHSDHAMGACEFDNVYMNHADDFIYENMADVAGRMEYVRINVGPHAKVPDQSEYLDTHGAYQKFHDLIDGTHFDLGGIKIEAYAFPGHTPGMMAILIPEERLLITGDGANSSTFLFEDYCQSIAEYKKTVHRLARRLNGKYDTVLISHHEYMAAPDLLNTICDVCDDILEGHSDEQDYTFMGRTIWWQKSRSSVPSTRWKVREYCL